MNEPIYIIAISEEPLIHRFGPLESEEQVKSVETIIKDIAKRAGHDVSIHRVSEEIVDQIEEFSDSL